MNFFDFGARHYSPVLTRWLTPDPLSEKYYGISPYAYCNGDPVNLVDPYGMNPIYDEVGNFIGVDDKGLQGDYIVMNKENFTCGMSHDVAMTYSINSSISEPIARTINQHYGDLPKRPDYDGIVTISEGIDWAKSHPEALQNQTPDNTLYVDASKLDFGTLTSSDFKSEGIPQVVNLFSFTNTLESIFNADVRNNVYALGQVSMTLLNKDAKTVEINNGPGTVYDWNEGGKAIRNACIKANNLIFNINPTIHGFNALYYGVGKLQK